MGLPKGYRKNLNLNPPNEGEIRRQELLDDIADNGTYLPKSVLHEDMDKSFVNFVENDLDLTLNGEKVPVVFLSIQRWAEFSKVWKHTNQFENIKIPFITIIRKPEAQQGTNQGPFKNIPGVPTFTYMKVPTWDGNRKGIDIYKIPQPYPVDMQYEVRLFCNRMRDLNKLNRKIIKTFAPLEHYIRVNGHPMPLELESIGDESEINNLDSRRYYVQNYSMLLKGYILDEDDFEVTPAIDRALVMTEIMSPKLPKVQKTVEIDEKIKTITLNFCFAKNVSSYIHTSEVDAIYNLDNTVNVNIYTIKVNGITQTLPFSVNNGDEIRFDFIRNTSDESKISLIGKII